MVDPEVAARWGAQTVWARVPRAAVAGEEEVVVVVEQEEEPIAERAVAQAREAERAAQRRAP